MVMPCADLPVPDAECLFLSLEKLKINLASHGVTYGI